MSGWRRAGVLVCAVAVVGCGGGEDEGPSVRPLEGVGESAGGLLVATVGLREVLSGEPDGWASFTESLPGAVLQIRVDDQPPGTRLAATLSRGGCGVGAADIQRVGQPFEVNDRGFRYYETRIPSPLGPLLDGEHSIRLVMADDPTATVACGDLPERPETPERVL